MPRWPAARGFGRFANDRGLSPFEAALIIAWADGGAPRGEGRLPEPRVLPGSRLDLAIELARRARPPEGDRRTFETPVRLPRERWISGWRFFPNDAAIEQAEFSLAGGRYLGNWVPPEEWVQLPAGVGIRLPAAAALSVTVWYRAARLQQDFPVGLPSLPPVLGFRFSRTSPAREHASLDVPCGDTLAAPRGEAIAVRPLLARPGSSVSIALAPPDAAPVPLARIRDFDPAYLATYRLREPAALTPGTRVVVESESADCRVLVEYAR
jgi:hypothetical protein